MATKAVKVDSTTPMPSFEKLGKVLKVVETITREYFFDGAAKAAVVAEAKVTAEAAPKVNATGGIAIGKPTKSTTKPKASGKKAPVKATPASSPDNEGQKNGFKKFGKPAWKWASFVCYSIVSMMEAGKTVDEIVAFINENLAKAEAKYGEAYANVMKAKIESDPKFLKLTIEQEA